MPFMARAPQGAMAQLEAHGRRILARRTNQLPGPQTRE